MQFKIKEMKGKAACEQLSKQDSQGALPGTAVRGFGQLSPKGEARNSAAAPEVLGEWEQGLSHSPADSCLPNAILIPWGLIPGRAGVGVLGHGDLLQAPVRFQLPD